MAGAVLVALAFAGLFLLQSALAMKPQGALAARLYPAFYGGLFLDEKFSRWVFRLWPLRAIEAQRSDPTTALSSIRS
jgi:hypothetical protein